MDSLTYFLDVIYKLRDNRPIIGAIIGTCNCTIRSMFDAIVSSVFYPALTPDPAMHIIYHPLLLSKCSVSNGSSITIERHQNDYHPPSIVDNVEVAQY